jgi:hypothetical protein
MSAQRQVELFKQVARQTSCVTIPILVAIQLSNRQQPVSGGPNAVTVDVCDDVDVDVVEVNADVVVDVVVDVVLVVVCHFRPRRDI